MPEKSSNSGGMWQKSDVAVVGISMVLVGTACYYGYRGYQSHKKKAKKKNKTASICGSYGNGNTVFMDHDKEHEDIRQEGRKEDVRHQQEDVRHQQEEVQQERSQETIKQETIKQEKNNQKVKEKGEQQCGRDQYLSVLKETVSAMETSIHDLAYQEDLLKMQSVDEETIAKKLNAHHLKEVTEARKRSLEKHNTTAEKVLLAAEKYNDEEITEQKKKIERIEAALRGEPIALTKEQLALIPVDFDIERLIKLFQELFERISTAHRETNEEVKRQLQNSSDAERQQLCTTINAKKNHDIKTDILAKYKITENILDIAMQKYMHEPRLQRTMMDLQKKQQQQAHASAD